MELKFNYYVLQISTRTVSWAREFRSTRRRNSKEDPTISIHRVPICFCKINSNIQITGPDLPTFCDKKFYYHLLSALCLLQTPLILSYPIWYPNDKLRWRLQILAYTVLYSCCLFSLFCPYILIILLPVTLNLCSSTRARRVHYTEKQ